jgi:NAD kinase
MNRRTALLVGSFNPPGNYHRAVAERLATAFDDVVVVPSAISGGQPLTHDVAPVDRAAMADLAFHGVPRTRVELDELEDAGAASAGGPAERLEASQEVWHVVAADTWRRGASTELEFEAAGDPNNESWKSARYAVVHAPGYQAAAGNLPPRHQLFEVEAVPASAEIRQRVLEGRSIDGLVALRVAAYITRHGLYRGGPPQRRGRMQLSSPKFMVVADDRSELAAQVAASIQPQDDVDPDLVVAIGGDGTMLRAIRQHWRRRVPIYGVNAGHLGFLLNETSPADLVAQSLIVEQLPLLYAETEGQDGRINRALAFNDAWVERAAGQAAWLNVQVDGRERLSQLVADGALVATAAGSTAYARAMGAIPVPLNTPVMLLVGSNVLRPSWWKPVVLPLDAQVELRTLDPMKRPLQGYIDGVSQGLVQALRARVSRVAAVELAFAPDHHPEAKLAKIQFPDVRPFEENPPPH